jgi:hypothetical protein
MKKLPERKRWIKKLDDITREIVLNRDDYCVIVGSHMGVMQNGHLITRARYGTRWDLYNCNCQCAGCNLKHEYYPEIYTDRFINMFGILAYRKLVKTADTISKYTIDDLETLYMELTEIRKKQEKNPEWKPYFFQDEIMSGEWKK